MNNFYLIGRVHEKPSIKETVNGLKYSQLLVEPCDAEGNFLNDSILSVTLFRGLAEAEYADGDLVGIRGKLQPNNYSKDDVIYYRTDLIGEKISIMKNL